MPTKLMLQDFDWAAAARTLRFGEQMFSGPAPDRPGCVVHPALPPEVPPPVPPSELDAFAQKAWLEIHGHAAPAWAATTTSLCSAQAPAPVPRPPPSALRRPWSPTATGSSPASPAFPRLTT